MRLETFRGTDVPSVFEAARRALGDDVMIVRTHVQRHAGVRLVELTATTAHEVERFQARLEPDPLPLALGHGRPYVVALAGPTGAGKTTAAAKLAVHPQAFGARRVGLLTLDTFRVGAVEQLGTFAEIAGLPLEVVYHPGEAAAALRRLERCEVVIVDTPGRGPRAEGPNQEWRAMLGELRPDETHLVLPATMRLDVAAAMREAAAGIVPTHLLLTKLDEVPAESGLADLALVADLPARWVTDGQEIPGDLRPAPQRVMASLGLSPPERGAARGAA